MLVRCVVASLLIATSGCSGTSEDPPQAPPLTEQGCQPGERELADKTCRSAGVPPDGCGVGFAADQTGGCEPVLPPRDCAAGEIAVPGDATCREIMPCGAGSYGDIPVEANSHYVDAAYGGTSDGSVNQPWTTIEQAVQAAPPGALIAVAAGSYVESVRIDKPVRLWGRCPKLVEVVGTLQQSVLVVAAGSGSELHGLSLSGASVGVILDDATDVLVDSVRIHDVGLRGVNVESAGPSLTLRGSVLEDAPEASMVVLGGDAVIEGSMVRTRPLGPATGQGIAVQKSDTGASASARVEGTLIDGAGTAGMRVTGGSLEIDSAVVRRGHAGQVGFGSGVLASPHPDGTRGQLTVRRSVIEDNQHSGIGVAGSDARVEATVVRRTLEAANGVFGRGITGEHEPITGHVATVTVVDSLVSDNVEVGIAQVAGTLSVEGTMVRATRPRVSDQHFGRGISIEDAGTPDLVGSLSIYAAVMEGNHDIGISVAGSTASVEHTLVRDMRARPDGQFGDGITVLVPGNGRNASASVVDCRVERSPRAGVASFGALVTLGSTVLECNSIQLDGESHGGASFRFDDLGDNRCGCGDVVDQCKVLSSSLEPPTSVAGP